ncbi:Uncharacterised protein [Legionella cincinnatiensis]|uniref:Uncharacterized protein n=1 Tax=Legionella cincinnatiensis TaxID=28085 RepID=A0A378ILB0_9GAMM|nr:Uncharacterised protein [Legionella cincinnatiensis]
MQKYVKGLSHPFFQKSEGEINENISVLDNAAKLRMFTD